MLKLYVRGSRRSLMVRVAETLYNYLTTDQVSTTSSSKDILNDTDDQFQQGINREFRGSYLPATISEHFLIFKATICEPLLLH